MKKLLILTLTTCIITFATTSCDPVESSDHDDSASVYIGPNRQEELTRLAQQAATRQFYSEVPGNSFREYTQEQWPLIESHERDYFDEAYSAARVELNKRQYPAITPERRTQLEKEGARAGKAVYESGGMSTRDSFTKDILVEYILGEQEIVLRAFDAAYQEAYARGMEEK